MTEIEQFYTREKANKGVKVDLYLPSGGPTDHYLIVRGIDSDHFKAANAAAKKEVAKLTVKQDSTEEVQRLSEIRINIISSLIAGWSFDDECTPENVKNMLHKAPQIADKVDQFAGNREEFFTMYRLENQNRENAAED